MFKDKMKVENISMPLSLKYSLVQIHKDMILLTITICLGLITNLQACVHLYIINRKTFDPKIETVHFITFHVGIYFGLIIRMLAILLFQKKARRYVFGCLRRKTKVVPETYKCRQTEKDALKYFEIYANQWN
uniref:Cytochrome-c oxidase n=1 Tax=Parastrongyloides trichosuri TaxID=131310 RepID=A0A0N4Z4C6_PARTI